MGLNPDRQGIGGRGWGRAREREVHAGDRRRPARPGTRRHRHVRGYARLPTARLSGWFEPTHTRTASSTRRRRRRTSSPGPRGTVALGTVRSPDRAEQLLDVRRRDRTRIRPCPGTLRDRSATSAGASSGMPRSRRRSKPPRRASSSTRAGGSSVPSASPKRAIASPATGSLNRSASGSVRAFNAPCATP